MLAVVKPESILKSVLEEPGFYQLPEGHENGNHYHLSGFVCSVGEELPPST